MNQRQLDWTLVAIVIALGVIAVLFVVANLQ